MIWVQQRGGTAQSHHSGGFGTKELSRVHQVGCWGPQHCKKVFAEDVSPGPAQKSHISTTEMEN